MRRRNAFTLAEVLVATALATALMSTAFLILSFSDRSRGVSASALALQTAALLEERITSDLARIVRASSALLRVGAKDPGRLSFFMFDVDGPRGKALPVRGVVYFRDPATGHARRECNGTVETIGLAPLEALRFHPVEAPLGPMVRVTLVVGRRPGEPAGPARVHTFLSRVASPRDPSRLSITRLSEFLDKEDLPRAPAPPAEDPQALPPLAPPKR